MLFIQFWISKRENDEVRHTDEYERDNDKVRHRENDEYKRENDEYKRENDEYKLMSRYK